MRLAASVAAAVATAIASATRSSWGLSTPRGARSPSPAPMDKLEEWAAERNAAKACVEHCFFLDRLALKGDLEHGALDFELEGGGTEVHGGVRG